MRYLILKLIYELKVIFSDKLLIYQLSEVLKNGSLTLLTLSAARKHVYPVKEEGNAARKRFPETEVKPDNANSNALPGRWRMR